MCLCAVCEFSSYVRLILVRGVKRMPQSKAVVSTIMEYQKYIKKNEATATAAAAAIYRATEKHAHLTEIRTFIVTILTLKWHHRKRR